MGKICVLVAVEPRFYREVFASTFRALHPNTEVITAEPDDLDREILHLRPYLVVCSQLTEVVQTRLLSWVLFYPDGDPTVTISIDGRSETRADVQLSDLLSLIDRTELLAGPANPCTPYKCRV